MRKLALRLFVMSELLLSLTLKPDVNRQWRREVASALRTALCGIRNAVDTQ